MHFMFFPDIWMISTVQTKDMFKRCGIAADFPSRFVDENLAVEYSSSKVDEN